jgi:hypothetical protein
MVGNTVSSRAYDGKYVCAAGVVWVALIAVGVHWMLTYENTPGVAAESPDRWPSTSRLMRPHDRFTLVMLAHPDCPCTRASLVELEKILVRTNRTLSAFVLFSKPGADRDEVQQSELWQRAAAIPGVSVVYDREGAEAARFHAVVSGQTLVYDDAGQLRFSGGITAARGQQGDNAGVEAVLDLAERRHARRTTTHIFGCALHDPDRETLRERGSRWTKH